jgi:ferritin-like metal-binding protein YciE
VFEYFTEAHELFVYRLGIARGTSRRAIVTLGTLEQHAQRREVNALMRDLQEEARLHAAVLEDLFADLERNVAVPPGHLADGLDHEAHMVLRKTDEPLKDLAVLPLALEALYAAIAIYEPLALYAREWLDESIAERLEGIVVEQLASRNRILDLIRRVFASNETVQATIDTTE